MVRDLAALALRNTLAVAAENEIGRQGHLQQAICVDGFGDQPNNGSNGRTLSVGAGPRVSSRGGSSTPMRKISSVQQPPSIPLIQSYSLPVTEPPMVWYHQCVVELLFKYTDALEIKHTDQRPPIVSLISLIFVLAFKRV